MVWTLLGLASIGVLAAVWLGVRAASAASHLRQAEALAGRISADLVTDNGDIGPLVEDLVEHAAAARALTDDFVWQGAEVLPWVGPQLQAVGTLSEGVDILAREVLQPLSGVFEGGGVETFLPRGGRIPVDSLAEVAAVTPSAKAAADRVHTLLEGVDTGPLLGMLRREFGKAQDSVESVVELVTVVDTGARLLPPLLGADGPRDYLVVVQNNAELRSLGGMPGALVHLRAVDGRLSLIKQYTALDFAVENPVEGMNPELADLYRGPDRLVSAVTQIPDFTVTAQLIQGFWTSVTGTPLDGVISMDPVALSYLLRATGPVALADDQTLTAQNAVPLLLNDVYLTLPTEQQDPYFASAASAVFSALTTGSFDSSALISAWEQGVAERRVMVWSAHEAQQEILVSSGLAGSLPTGNQFGVYLNDGTGSKMDYYLDATAEIQGDDADPARSELVVRLSNAAPADAASLPRGVTGGGNYGVPAGVIRTVVYVYLPQGSAASSLQAEGFSPFRRGTHDGHEVLVTWVDLAPGESAVARVGAPVGNGGPPSVLMTPQSGT